MHGNVPRFANPTVTVQSWYVAQRSKALPRGRVLGLQLLNRRLVFFRDTRGAVHALDARCPHLGADLGEGSVRGDMLRCTFHGWCFDGGGQCVDAPKHEMVPQRRVRSYPVRERWGLIWIFNGPEATFELPDVPGGGRVWTVRTPPQRIRCHPHLVIGNGLDAVHFDVLHGFEFTEEPRLEVAAPNTVTLHIRGRPRSKRMQWATRTTRRDLVASFTAIGGSMAWATVEEPLRFHVLFTGRTDEEGGCVTQTVGFLRSRNPLYVARAFATLYMLLKDDHCILDTLQFSRSFTALDAQMEAYASSIDEMELW